MTTDTGMPARQAGAKALRGGMSLPEPQPPARLFWQTVPIEAIAIMTPRVKSFALEVEWPNSFRAGQYVDVRLTAPDGYQAQRSYSVASAPSDIERIEIMVERLEDGEVSSFFHDIAEPGDTVELRGPIGLPFSWAPEDGGPLLLIGGGSGVVPLLSMLRHRAAAAPAVAALLLYSARTADEAICREELLRRAATEPAFDCMLALTRDPGVAGTIGRRIDRALVDEALRRLPGVPARTFVCGSNNFVGAVADLLVDAGLPSQTIRTERFG